MAHVVILGGGFGGLAAAHELRTSRPDLDVTLVDRGGRFFMGFAKIWDLVGMRPLDEGTRPLTDLDGTGVRYLRADIVGIDPDARTVTTDAETLEADAIVVALGAGSSPAHTALLSGDGAYDLYDPAQLPAMRAALGGLDEGRVVVSILGMPFKCPPAPFEAALLIAEHLRNRGVGGDVEMVVSTPQPVALPVAGPDASSYVAGFLDEWGVELRAEHKVASVDADTRQVTFENGATEPYTLLFGVPAAAPPPILAESGLAGDGGWIDPDRQTLRTGFDRVYAVGDCTQVPTAKGLLPKAGVFAAAEGVVAARNVVADLEGGETATFDGHGYCFLELPGERVAFVEGDFYAEPEPDVELTEADRDQFERKQAFERERLDAWLG